MFAFFTIMKGRISGSEGETCYTSVGRDVQQANWGGSGVNPTLISVNKLAKIG